MKKTLLIISAILMLNFMGCGGSGNKEAKELLQRILRLVGIPQSIVVNICQDDSNNGFCEENELQAKLTVNKGDTLQDILQKIQFEADGTYILNDFNLTQNILMEIVDNETLNNTGQKVTLSFNPIKNVKEQELSILQALVDKGLLDEEDVKEIRTSDARSQLDAVLLENLFENQTILIENNITKKDATARNLEYIAEGLLDVNISSKLVQQLEACNNDSSCEATILKDVNEQTQITEKEAQRIADTNSIEGTGDNSTSLTIENNSRKNAVDGYIIKLASVATATCYNSDFTTILGTYTSSLIVKEKGELIFKDIVLTESCSISVPSGATIDSNNNGVLDSNDKIMTFEMKSFGDYSYISLLTTLAYEKKQKAEDISVFASMVKDFDSVRGASAIANASGVEKIKLQKLLILTEVLKTSLQNKKDITQINLSNVINSTSTENISNFQLTEISSLGSEVLFSTSIRKKEEIMRELVNLLEFLDPSEIDLDMFLVNVSDGEKNIEESINASRKVSVVGDIFEFPVRNNTNVVAVASKLRAINDLINGSSDDTTTIETQPTAVAGATVEALPAISETDYFITTWKTDNYGNTADDQIEILTNSAAYSYDYFIDWGDGTSNTHVTGDITHTYPTKGIYTVKIYGEFPQIYNRNKHKLLAIEQWGTMQWKSMEQAFSGCSNLVGNASDVPNLSNVSTMNSMFNYAFEFNQDIGSWNVSNVTDMTSMFNYASKFNQNIGSWDVSNVTNMNLMFHRATNFNQDIGSWNVSNVRNTENMFKTSNFNQDISSWNISKLTDMSGMFQSNSKFNQDISSWNVSTVTDMNHLFQSASAFNQDISSWNVSNVTNMNSIFTSATAFNQDIGSWNVSNVTNMNSMFSYATIFNQDIGSWNVSKVTNMNSMFRSATAFNQDIGSWNVSNVIDMRNMFYNADFSTLNYDKLLIGWDGLGSLHKHVTLDVGRSEYDRGWSAKKSIIDTYGWTINDGGSVFRGGKGVGILK